MIDHLTLAVSNYETGRAFYTKALAPLGYAVVIEFSREQVPTLSVSNVCGPGVAGKPDLWLAPGDAKPTHVAFRCDDRAAVGAFYRAALEAGGRLNGEPGLRPHYHANDYGAFVLDPDGYNVEAVCHTSA